MTRAAARRQAAAKRRAAPPKPPLTLVGQDGNAFAILGRAIRAAQHAGWPQQWIDEYKSKATSGDYDHLLAVTMNYFDVQ